jgi:glycine cleavage system regulatory protein
MRSHIKEYVEAAVEVAREDARLLRVDETAQKIAAAAGEPDHVGEIADLLLRTCIEHGITVEIEHASDVQRQPMNTPP